MNKKKTKTSTEIYEEHGISSGQGLAEAAKNMIPFRAFKKNISVAREEAKTRGIKPVKAYIQTRSEDLARGMTQATSIARDPRGTMIQGNPTARKAKQEYDDIKGDYDNLKKQAKSISEIDMSKPVKVSASTPRSSKGKPYRKPEHTRKKPKR